MICDSGGGGSIGKPILQKNVYRCKHDDIVNYVGFAPQPAAIINISSIKKK